MRDLEKEILASFTGYCKGPNEMLLKEGRRRREPITWNVRTDGERNFNCRFLIGRQCTAPERVLLPNSPSCIVLYTANPTEKIEIPDKDIFYFNTFEGDRIYDSNFRMILGDNGITVRLSPALGSIFETLVRNQGKVVPHRDLYLSYHPDETFIPRGVSATVGAHITILNKRYKEKFGVKLVYNDLDAGFYLPDPNEQAASLKGKRKN